MPDTLSLLESSFAKIQPKAIAFSHSFYQHLFEIHPELEAMFAEVSPELQEKKLVASLALIVENLHNPQALSQALQGLGAHHLTKGTEAAHYPLVGQALLQALQEHLGDDWTPEVAQAWLEAYKLISDMMLEGTRHTVSIGKFALYCAFLFIKFKMVGSSPLSSNVVINLVFFLGGSSGFHSASSSSF